MTKNLMRLLVIFWHDLSKKFIWIWWVVWVQESSNYQNIKISIIKQQSQCDFFLNASVRIMSDFVKWRCTFCIFFIYTYDECSTLNLFCLILNMQTSFSLWLHWCTPAKKVIRYFFCVCVYNWSILLWHSSKLIYFIFSILFLINIFRTVMVGLMLIPFLLTHFFY